jgi:D-aspartate ligase
MKKSGQIYSVLVPDGEKSLLRSLLNCFSQIKNIRVYVMATKKDLPLRYSKYVDQFFFFPPSNDPLYWIANINKVTREHPIDVIMPIWETSIKSLIENKDRLESWDKLVPLPSLQNFTIARSKSLLADHLKRFDFPGPKSLHLRPSLLQGRSDLDLNFPLLAKPLPGGSGRGIEKFEDYETFTAYFRENGLRREYILQEFIKGEDYGCNVLCSNGEILAFTMQKGNLWDPSKPYSAQIGMDFLYEEKLLQTVRKLMKSLDWNGIADLDLLYHKESDTFYIVEINPRFWATLTAALMAGINYPQLLIKMTMKQKIEPQRYKLMPYVNLKGFKLLLKKDKAFIFRPKFIWNNTPVRYRLDDPMPIFISVLQKARSIVKKKFEIPIFYLL